MPQHVIAFDGPVGVGKTTLGRAVSQMLGLGFVDGDDHSDPGPWLRSSLRTSRRIAAECQQQLSRHPAVILAYPLRCTNWVFYKETFSRQRISFSCIGLSADLDQITNRNRVLSPDEKCRAAQMLSQGYGTRPFSSYVIRTDECGFAETRDRLAQMVRSLVAA